MLTIFATAASFIYFWTIYDDGLHLLSSARHEILQTRSGTGIYYVGS